MIVSEFLKTMSYGELSNLAMAEVPGEIKPASIPKVLLAADEALTRLHSKFLLSQKEVLIQQIKHITFYHLNSKYSVHRVPREFLYPYIIDGPIEPFQDDVARIIAVYDSEGGELPLNDRNQFHSVFTPQLNVLQIPNPNHGQSLSVQYQACHAKLSSADLNQKIYLPEALWGAFRAFTAYQVFSQMGGENHVSRAAEHLSMYNAVCSEVSELSLTQESETATNNRFFIQGWR